MRFLKQFPYTSVQYPIKLMRFLKQFPYTSVQYPIKLMRLLKQFPYASVQYPTKLKRFPKIGRSNGLLRDVIPIALFKIEKE